MFRHSTARRGRINTAATLLCLLFGTLAVASDAAPTEYRFQLARQSLFAAILEISTQTELSIGSNDPGVRDVMVGPLDGVYSVEAALRALLANTGFEFQRIDDSTYAIARRPVEAPESSSPVVPIKQPEQTSMATADHGREVMVTRSRFVAPEMPTEIVALSRGSFERYGASSIADILQYLPSQHPQAEAERVDGGQYVDLRGLGAESATVMIDGRWLPPTATSGIGFDLNTIPVTAIERVEVLSDASAAAIGVPSIGGVLNLVLTKNIPSPIASSEYGAAAGGGEQRRASFGVGLDRQRLHGALSVDYFERDALSGEQRSRWANQDFRRFGGEDWRSLTSQPGNIRSIDGEPLPGLSSSFAAVPAGSSGVRLTPNDFAATAGQRNLSSPRRYLSVVPAARRLSAAGTAELSFSRFTTFAEWLYTHRTNIYQRSPPELTDVDVPATNAFNPFGETVRVSIQLSAFGPRETFTETELTRMVAGMRGQLNGWSWELSALRSEENALSWTRNELDATRVAYALSSSDPALALNVFQDGAGGSSELLGSLIARPFTNVYSSNGTMLAGSMQGPLWMLPAGKVMATLGTQWRSEGMSIDTGMRNDVNRVAAAWLGDLRVPLLPSLDLGISGRADYFNDLGRMFTPNYALKWRPLSALQLHASYGTSFRVPSAYELFGPRYSVQIPVADPLRPGETSSVTAFVGSSPDLRTVRGRSFRVGATLTPATLPDLNVSASYWVTHVNDRIATVPFWLLLEREGDFPGRVMRDARTESDVAAGLPGQLWAIDLSPMNFGRLQTSGIDAHVSYGFDTGTGSFRTSLSGTWVDEYTTLDWPGSPPTDRVGVADRRGTIPQWRAFAAIQWQRRFTELSAMVRCVAPFEDTSGTVRNGRSVPAQTFLDLSASLDLDRLLEPTGPWSGLSVTTGVLNVFDVEPAFAEVGQDAGFDPSQGDLRQRFVYFRLRKRF
ncbi:MAG: TonB-dependent receptor [Steroidobacter sp.]